MVFFERGSHGFEEPFVSKSVEEWIEHFKKETKESTGAKYPNVFYLQKTFQDADGNTLVDEKGDRITETIYLNDDVVANLANV